MTEFLLLRHRNVDHLDELSVYQGQGGFETFKKAVTQMQPGDVLFFNGQVVHGSLPNRSSERFRRSLIGHYIGGEAREVAKFYHPALRMDGSLVTLETSEGGGSCGIWVNQDGRQVIELAGVEGLAKKSE